MNNDRDILHGSSITPEYSVQLLIAPPPTFWERAKWAIRDFLKEFIPILLHFIGLWLVLAPTAIFILRNVK